MSDIEIPKYYCLKCKEEMRSGPQSFDVMAIFTPTPHYCENKECDRYGLLSMLAANMEG